MVCNLDLLMMDIDVCCFQSAMRHISSMQLPDANGQFIRHFDSLFQWFLLLNEGTQSLLAILCDEIHLIDFKEAIFYI